MRRLTLLVVFVAFAFSCGGQWPVLQCIAWANMIGEYSQVVPLAEAVHMTFSGQYPCALCKAIAEKKKEQDIKFATLFDHEKKVCSPSLVLKSSFPSVTPQSFLSRERLFESRTETPPTPPPRLV